MAKTKQTARKTSPHTGTHRQPSSSDSEPNMSPGGNTIATFPVPTRRSPQKRLASSPVRSTGSKKTHINATSGFSSEDSQDFLSSHKNLEDDEVTFNYKGTSSSGTGKLAAGGDQGGASGSGKQPRQPIPKKDLKKVQQGLIRAQQRGKTGLQKLSHWNKFGKRHTMNETKWGWLKKAAKNKDEQGRILRRNCPWYSCCPRFIFTRGPVCF